MFQVQPLLIELHYLLSTASVVLSNSVIQDVFENHNFSVDQLVIKEVSNALSSFNPLLKAVSKNGPLGTAFKPERYYREHVGIVDPVEYILVYIHRSKTFQYVPILKSLQQLLKQKDVLNK